MVCPSAGLPARLVVQVSYPEREMLTLWPGVPVLETSTVTGEFPLYWLSKYTFPPEGTELME